MDPHYEQLKRYLLNDPHRKIIIAGRSASICEGQGMVKHACSGSIDLNHVLYTRQPIQKLPKKDRKYFDNKINCALNCRHFHEKYGHSSAYRIWHHVRMILLYGADVVNEYIAEAPLKVNQVARRQLSVLFLDDSAKRIAFAKTLFNSYDLTVCTTANGTIKALKKKLYDVVCLDHDLGGEVFADSNRADTGAEVVRWIVRNKPPISQVIVHSLNFPAAIKMTRWLTVEGYSVVQNPMFC